MYNVIDRHRAYLVYQIARAIFLSKDKNALLGILWHVLHPLALSAVLLCIFTYKFNVQVENFGFYILLGLTHFNLFSQVTSEAASSMVSYRSMVLSSTVPREVIIYALTANASITFFAELIVILVLMLMFGIQPTLVILLYPVVFTAQILLILGIALLLAITGIFFRDMAYAWNIFTRMMFFFVPIFYVLDPLGDRWFNDLLRINPISQVLILSRECILYGHVPNLLNLMILLAVGTSTFLIGLYAFKRYEPRIADQV